MNDTYFQDDPPPPAGAFNAEVLDKPRAAYKPWFPALDISDTGEAYLYTFDLPGLTRERVQMRVDGNLLCLAGVRPTAEEGETRLRAERPSGAFVRHLDLPEDSQIEESRATISDGVLRLRIPKQRPVPGTIVPAAASMAGARTRATA